MRLPNNLKERGQALVIIALAAIVLFGFAGLAIDGSAKFSDRRHAQNAADTAALAAALSKVNELTAGTSDTPADCPPVSGTPSDVCTALVLAGLNRAASNGYNNDVTTNVVEVYSPPISGYYATVANKDKYVQVIITSHVKTTLMRVLGFNQTVNVVSAVAYAKEGYDLADGAMVISYDPTPNCSTGGTGGYSVEVTGSATVNLTGGGIFLNSHAVCGFKIPNCADLNITGGSINTVGDNIDTTGCTFDPPLGENIDQPAIGIPDGVYWPDRPPQCNPSYATPSPTKLGEVLVGTKIVEEWLIYPGFYTDFPSPSLVANKSNIYMASGIYCVDPPMNQDLSWSPVDAASLNGSTDPLKNKYSIYNPDGVTIYITKGGGFSLNANSPTKLDASTSGDLQGYLIILEGVYTSIQDCTITGGADLDINGLIFAPYCDITVNGGSDPTAEINAQLIGWDIKINGNTTINFNYDPSNQVIVKRRIGLMK